MTPRNIKILLMDLGQSRDWLARQLHISASTLDKIIDKGRPLKPDELSLLKKVRVK